MLTLRREEAQDPPRSVPGAHPPGFPWERLEERIRPYYQPYPLSMLRVHWGITS